MVYSRREQGNKGAAIRRNQKRKTELLQGEKLPEQLRAKRITFSELAADAIERARGHKLTWQDDEIRLTPMREAIPVQGCTCTIRHPFASHFMMSEVDIVQFKS